MIASPFNIKSTIVLDLLTTGLTHNCTVDVQGISGDVQGMYRGFLKDYHILPSMGPYPD